MMAPRPTLLTYNAEDDCCFKAGLVKPGIYDDVRPFFKLYGKKTSSSGMRTVTRARIITSWTTGSRITVSFGKQFDIPLSDNEEGVATEIKSYDELKVGPAER